jgi:hypothetical protein
MSLAAAKAFVCLSAVPETDTQPALMNSAQRPAIVFFNAFICDLPFCFYVKYDLFTFAFRLHFSI